MTSTSINQNAATRLFNFLRLLQASLSTQKPVANAWREASGLPPSEIKSDNLEPASALATATRITIQTIAAQLAARSVPDHLYAMYVTRLIAVTDISLHHQPLQVTAQFMDGETMLALQWWAYVLPDDGGTVADADIDELRMRLNELEAAVNQPGIPAELRTFALDHLQTLRNALMLYPLQGVTPIQAAVQAAVGKVALHGEEMKAATVNPSPETETLLSKLGGVMKKSVDISGYAKKTVENLSFVFDKAIEYGTPVVKAVKGAFD